MKYPELVPNCVCTTPIKLTIESEDIDEDGAPATEKNINAMCNWQDGGKAVYTADLKIIEISGRAFFNGDIVPSLSNITGGEAVVHGMIREIHKGMKWRNPDGTVNYTEIQFK